MDPVFALRVLALALAALIASQPALLAYAERAVDPYEALFSWLKKNLVVVGITPYRGVNYPVIGEYRDPIVLAQTEPGENMREIGYREYLNKLLEGKINLKATIRTFTGGAQRDLSLKLNLDPVFLTWGTYFSSHPSTKSYASCTQLGNSPNSPITCTNKIYYDASSAYLEDPSYLYSYVTLTNGSKLKLPKGENLVLALAFKGVDIAPLVSSALGGKFGHVQFSLDLRSILSKAPVDDPYFGVFIVEWGVKGQSGSLYKVGRGLQSILRPDLLYIYYKGDAERDTFEVSGVGWVSEDPLTWVYTDLLFPDVRNIPIFKPIGPPMDSVRGLVNVNMAPGDAFLASSSMYVIKPEAYSGIDRVEVVVSDVRGKFKVLLSFDIEVGGERFNFESQYTLSESKIVNSSPFITQTHFNTWNVRVDKLGYDQYGSLRLKITLSYAYSVHENWDKEGQEQTLDGEIITVVLRASSIYNERVRVEKEISIGGYTLNPAPPHGVIMMPGAVAEITVDEQGSSTLTKSPLFLATVTVEKYHRATIYEIRHPEYGYRRDVYNHSILLHFWKDGFISEQRSRGIWSSSASLSKQAYLFLYFEGSSLHIGISLGSSKNVVEERKETSFYWPSGVGSISWFDSYERVGCETYPGGAEVCVTKKYTQVIYSDSYYESSWSETSQNPYFNFYLPKGAQGSLTGGIYIYHPRKIPLQDGTPSKMVLAILWRKAPEEASRATGPLGISISAEDDLVSGGRGFIEVRLYGDKVEGVPVDVEAKLVIPFTRVEGDSVKSYNKSLEVELEPRMARTDESGRAVFLVSIPSIEDLRAKLGLSEDELKNIRSLSMAILHVRAKAGDLEAKTGVPVVISGVYAKINVWDVDIPLPQNLWGSETVTGYVGDRFAKKEEFIKKYRRARDPNLKVEVEIESLDGQVVERITGTKLLKAEIGRLEPGGEYKISYTMNYKDKTVLEARDVARFKLGNGSKGLEIVEVNVYVPASLYLKYLELKQILEGSVYHNYMIPLGDPALVLTLVPVMPIIETLAKEIGVNITIDDWAYIKPKVKVPDWGDKGTELEVFGKISYLDPRFNLTFEALDDPESYWSKMAKLIIIMAETIRTYKYMLTATKALSIITSLIATLAITKGGLYSWKYEGKIDQLRQTSQRIDSFIKKVDKGRDLLGGDAIRRIKMVKIGALVTEGASLTLRAYLPLIQPVVQEILSKLGADADDAALAFSMYVAVMFKVTRFAPTIAQGMGDLMADIGFEILFQLLILLVSHAVNAITNSLVQMVLDSEVKAKGELSRWASREDAQGALRAASSLSSAEEVFNKVADTYMAAETIAQLGLSVVRGLDGIVEIGTKGKAQLKLPDYIAKILKMPVNVEVEQGKFATYKTKDITTKLYISLVAALLTDTMIKPLWLLSFKAALAGDKNAWIARPGAVTDVMNILFITLQTVAPLVASIIVARLPAKIEGSTQGGTGAISLSTPGDPDLENLKSSLESIRTLKPRILESLQLSTYDARVLVDLSDSIDLASKALMRLYYRASDLNLKLVFGDHHLTIQTLSSHLDDVLVAFIGEPSLRPTGEHLSLVEDLIDSITLTLEESINTTSNAVKSRMFSEKIEEAIVFVSGVSTTPEGWLEVEIVNLGDVSATARVSVAESDVLGPGSAEVSLSARGVETVILKPVVKKDVALTTATLTLDVNGVSSTYEVDVLLDPRLRLSVSGDTVVIHDGSVSFEGGKLRVSNLTFVSFMVSGSDSRFIVYLDGGPVRTGLVRFGNYTLVSSSFSRPVAGVLEVKAVESRVEVVSGSGVLETSLGVSIVSEGPSYAKVEMLRDNPYPEAGLDGGGSVVVLSLDIRGEGPVRVIVNLDVLGVSDVGQVKVYKYSSAREAYVEIEGEVDARSRTVTFTINPGDPVVAITSKPIKPGGEGARIVYTEAKIKPPQVSAPQAGVEGAGGSLWFYVALVAVAIAVAFTALVVLARFRRRS